jgi:hypothetical protein
MRRGCLNQQMRQIQNISVTSQLSQLFMHYLFIEVKMWQLAVEKFLIQHK